MSKLLDFNQELRELGARGTMFRVQWEIRGRLGLVATQLKVEPGRYAQGADLDWSRRLPFADAPSVAPAIASLLDDDARNRLVHLAGAATHGEILAFGRWPAHYGTPINWNLNPRTGQQWPSGPAMREIGTGSPAGDVKLTWEVARFPHAYYMTRAATLAPAHAQPWATSLLDQMRDFAEKNPPGVGVHWTSGQEVAFRLLAWVFALDVFLSRTPLADQATALVGDALIAGATYIEAHLDYARLAVYNNHLLSEAVALFGVGALLADAPRAATWRALGRQILDQEAERQFYEDGGYIQQSHNYHRVALQDLLWACAFAKSTGDRPSPSWLRAMERSLDLLFAHQNPLDGRLPNYGSNDGSHPSPLSGCDFSDFRPTLQAVSLATRGERIYTAGPWDEEAAWFLGPKALDIPLRTQRRTSVSFTTTGYHVLRGRDESSFGMFRCGSLRDRFSQIDMLNLDVWWRGHNVLVDGGSYLYNGPEEWHDYFMSTASHNTVSVDGRDQMLHFRQFKVLYWTEAALLDFQEHANWALCCGEHYGFRRHPGACVHRRSILFAKEDLWIVVDHVSGNGEHTTRLQWLCGDYPHTHDAARGTLTLETGAGPFTVSVTDERGSMLPCDVVRGQEHPPRGWLSRYYAERVPVPSLAVSQTTAPPSTFVSLLSGVPAMWRVDGSTWSVRTSSQEIAFEVAEGRIGNVCTTE